MREDGSGPNAVRASGTGAGGRWQVEGGVGGGGGGRGVGGGGGGEAERGHAGSGQSARTSRANGSFLISSSVDRWYLRISRSATVPGLRVPGKGC